jgi:hypothetical protein
MELLVRIATDHPRVLADPPPRAFLIQFADSSINLELGFWIDDPEKGKGNVVSEINLAIWHAFRENGISIPSRSARCACSAARIAAKKTPPRGGVTGGLESGEIREEVNRFSPRCHGLFGPGGVPPG